MAGSNAAGAWRLGVVAVVLVAAGALAGGGLARALAQQHTHPPGHAHSDHGPEAGGWLLKLKGDDRFRAIERQFRGFETTMAEVSYRYVELYFAGLDGNWGYADHMAEEMKEALAAGLERRPALRKNAEALFLKGPLPQTMEAIKRKDPELFKQRMEAMRAACTACHAAEGLPFIKIGVPQARRNPVEKP